MEHITPNHSYSNYKMVEIEHLYLDLNVSFKQKKLNGIAHLKINRLSSGVDKLILDTKALVIKEVKDGLGNQLHFALGDYDAILGRPLQIDIGDTITAVLISYETTDSSEALQWQTPQQTFGKTHPFLYTQSQAILARTWIPLQDCPAVRFTYNAKVTVDEDVLPLMSATNPVAKNTNKTYTYNMPQPIPSYLMALCAGNLAYQTLGDSCGVYAEPTQLQACASEFKDLQSMIDSASLLYDDYQWGKYDIVVLPPSFPFGGMENPRLTFATPTIIAGDRSLVSLVAHELAHSWSGNLVTNETWADFWLNEGFTVYFENRIMEKIYGKPYADMLAVLGMGELQHSLKEMMVDMPNDTKLYLDLDGRNPDDGVTDIAYEKGRFFLLMIEKVVGRSEFDSFLSNYFKKNAFKTINTKAFISILNKDLLSKNPMWKSQVNLEEWIYEPGLPKNCPAPTSIAFEKITGDVALFLGTGELPNITQYTTHHWLQFLRQMPENIGKEKMAILDKAFKLTETGNAEIACDWFKLSIINNYTKAYPNMEAFLLKVGRRKFLTPLYGAMKSSGQLNMAKAIYAKAKQGYHAVSTATISALLYE